MATNSLYPKDWIKTAGKDWERIFLHLQAEDLEAAAFFLQQALEKYLKAFLLERGWSLKKIHHLPALLEEATKYQANLADFGILCERISAYYLTERYPQMVPSELTQARLKSVIEEALTLVHSLFPGENLKMKS